MYVHFCGHLLCYTPDVKIVLRIAGALQSRGLRTFHVSVQHATE
jgi:hypothetical protein